MPVVFVEKYGRNTRSRRSAGIPGPLSVITTWTCSPPSQCVAITTSVAPASTALSTRFRTARLSWSPSASSVGRSPAKSARRTMVGCVSP